MFLTKLFKLIRYKLFASIKSQTFDSPTNLILYQSFEYFELSKAFGFSFKKETYDIQVKSMWPNLLCHSQVSSLCIANQFFPLTSLRLYTSLFILLPFATNSLELNFLSHNHWHSMKDYNLCHTFELH